MQVRYEVKDMKGEYQYKEEEVYLNMDQVYELV